jgi:5'-nucleotidase
VVGGDSHTLLGPEALEDYGVGSPAGAYAEAVSNKDGDPACLVQAWEYSQVVGELQVGFDAAGKVTRCAGTPHVLIGDSFTLNRQAATAAEREAILADIAASGFLRVTAADTQAQETLQPYKAEVDVFKARQVALSPVELCLRRVPGGPGSVDYGRSSAGCNAAGKVSERGGDIQQLVANAYLEVANAEYGGADITLQSGGGVRVPLQGVVTAANVIEVVPFGNMLWRLELTGAEVKGMVEDGLHAVFREGGSTGPYPYAGGLRWHVDANQAHGQRAGALEVYSPAARAWEPLDTSRSYRLFVLSFNATGGDGYTTLKDVPAERRLDIGVLDADVLQSYIDNLARDPATGLPVLQAVPDDWYSTQGFIGPVR